MSEHLHKLLTHIVAEHPEGMLLYLFGALTITLIHLINSREWRIGLKGENKIWEAPEICIYLFTWLFPHMIMADQFLALKASDLCWYFMLGLLAFGLTGRFGLNWLLAFKNGQSKVTETDLPKSSIPHIEQTPQT